MTTSFGQRARLNVNRLEGRELPAFLAPVTSPGGGSQVAIGDVNHDGRDDIAAVGNNKGLTVSVSNGDGPFRRASQLTGAKGYFRTDLRMADVNGGGNLDVVLDKVDQKYYQVVYVFGYVFYNYVSHSNVWLGRGDGTFGHGATTTSSASFSEPVTRDHIPISAFADINRDGIADRIGLNPLAGAIDVELGNGNVSYQPPRTFAAGPNPETLAVGDFNGDGWTDVIVVNSLSSSQPTLSVCFNDGTW